MRWRVERAGAPTGGGYLRGWLAMSSEGVGAYFPTHAEAFDFAERQAIVDRARHEARAADAERGLMKLRARAAVAS